MPLVRYAAFLLLISAAVLLTGARNSQSARDTPTSANSEAHAAAVKRLDDALERLGPNRIAWLEMKLWQKGRLGGYSVEAEGLLLAGPSHRLRLELTTRHGRAATTTLAVSDGLTLWQGNRFGDGPWADLVRLDLKQILQSPQPAAPPNGSGDLLRGQSIGSVVRLLRTLRSGMQWSRMENVRRGGRHFIKLVGAWSEENRSAISSPTQPWPEGMPRQCRLYLDPANLWLHRLEWWGPGHPNGSDTLLMQIEFRDPVINQPMTEERAAREFHIPVAAEQASEQTAEALERARQLLAQPAIPH